MLRSMSVGDSSRCPFFREICHGDLCAAFIENKCVLCSCNLEEVNLSLKSIAISLENISKKMWSK